MRNLRVLIAGGGTGGHLFPALAVARELVAKHGADVLFVGTARGLETRLVPGAGFPLKLIEVGPLNHVSLITRVKTLLRLPASISECKELIREYAPNVVFGIGGYAAGPGTAAALRLKVPVLLFEPNAVPGLTNRLAGKRVQGAVINFAEAAQWFNHPEVTGVPVRPEFFSIPASASGTPHLLIFGGSQGARIFNQHLPRIARELLDAVPGLTILHQSGLKNYETTLATYQASGAEDGRWEVRAFLDDMPAQFARAHLLLSRSGASTVGEECAAGKAALLVPFAAAADNHQKRNAEAIVAAGGAIMLEEPDLNVPGKLLSVLVDLLRSPERLNAMGKAARAQAHPDAAERIAAKLAALAEH